METVLYTNEILVINKKTWKLNLNSKNQILQTYLQMMESSLLEERP
jgi:hypothetical protein